MTCPSLLRRLVNLSGVAILIGGMLPCAGQQPPTPDELKLIESHERANAEQIAEGERRALQESIDRYLSRLAETGDRGWVASLRNLGLPPERGVPVFTELLEHSDPVIRAEAAYSLGHYGAKAAPAFNELLNVYRADADLAGAEAARALGAIGPAAAAAVPVLGERLGMGSGSSRFLQASTSALGALGPLAAGALPVLEAQFRNRDTRVAYAAYLAVGEIRQDPPMDRDNLTRQGVEALSGRTSHSANRALRSGVVLTDTALRILHTYLRGEDKVAPEQAAALGTLATLSPSDPDSVTILLDSLESEDPLLVEFATTALAEFTPSDAATIPVLTRAVGAARDRVASRVTGGPASGAT